MQERSAARTAGTFLLALGAAVAIAAPLIASNPPSAQYRALASAPPSRVRLIDAEGRWRGPFIYPHRVADRLERRYEEDRATPVPLVWFRGSIIRSADPERAPLLLLGADSLGRDVFARLVYGARTSLGVAGLATLGALLIGLLVGGIAGSLGGWLDDGLMRVADFVLVLPALYVLLAFRAMLPLVLQPQATFVLVSGLLALVGWPSVARGVRAILLTERGREHVLAARSLGATRLRVLVRHELPATRGFVATQSVLLLAGFLLAEATLSFVGLGFVEPTPSWGSMLVDAADITAAARMPWLLAPVGAIVLMVLATNLTVAE